MRNGEANISSDSSPGFFFADTSRRPVVRKLGFILVKCFAHRSFCGGKEKTDEVHYVSLTATGVAGRGFGRETKQNNHFILFLQFFWGGFCHF